MFGVPIGIPLKMILVSRMLKHTMIGDVFCHLMAEKLTIIMMIIVMIFCSFNLIIFHIGKD